MVVVVEGVVMLSTTEYGTYSCLVAPGVASKLKNRLGVTFCEDSLRYKISNWKIHVTSLQPTSTEHRNEGDEDDNGQWTPIQTYFSLFALPKPKLHCHYAHFCRSCHHTFLCFDWNRGLHQHHLVDFYPVFSIE